MKIYSPKLGITEQPVDFLGQCNYLHHDLSLVDVKYIWLCSSFWEDGTSKRWYCLLQHHPLINLGKSSPSSWDTTISYGSGRRPLILVYWHLNVGEVPQCSATGLYSQYFTVCEALQLLQKWVQWKQWYFQGNQLGENVMGLTHSANTPVVPMTHLRKQVCDHRVLQIKAEMSFGCTFNPHLTVNSTAPRAAMSAYQWLWPPLKEVAQYLEPPLWQLVGLQTPLIWSELGDSVRDALYLVL